MKAITPVNIWHEGSLKEATLLDVVSSYDDLKSYATFSYRVMKADPAPEPNQPVMSPPVMMNNVVASGSVNIGGQDYIDWDNSNDAAYEYVADKLNLVIVVPE